MIHWLLHFLGMDNLSGPFYGFWSGSGSDVGEIAIIGGMVTLVRKHNCHTRGCWRVGRFPAIEGGGWGYCRRHHSTNGEHT